MMAELVVVDITSVDANPFRALDKYPYVERKIDALKRSIADVGLWEGVIGRRIGNRTEIAFGHHRIKAAHDSGLSHIAIIIRDLTDEQMLQFMGRENMEDYNADFLCMLETWEAGATFLPFRNGNPPASIDVAKLLGWTEVSSDRGSDQLNATARACAAAHALLTGGYVDRADFTDVSVRAAKEICERAQSRNEQLERMGKQTLRPEIDLIRAKTHVGAAVKETLRQWRGGSIAQKDLRGTVDVNAYREARKDPHPSPLFETFGKALAESISRMLKGDSTEARLEEVRKALGDVTLDDDKRVIARLDFELGELGERTVIWRKRIMPTEKKVSTLQIAKREE